MKAQSEGSTTVGEEETSIRVEKALAFLDTWNVVESDGSISTKVSRKDTHTDQYLNFDRNHPLEHKKGVVRTLMNSADRLVRDETELRWEKDHIRKALQVNGYLDWMLADDRMSDQLDPGQDEGVDGTEGVEKDEMEQSVPPTTTAFEGPCAPVARKKYPVVLPYVRGVSEH